VLLIILPDLIFYGLITTKLILGNTLVPLAHVAGCINLRGTFILSYFFIFVYARLEASEKKAQLLNAEVQSLRQEKNNIKSNLEKAEIEVR